MTLRPWARFLHVTPVNGVSTVLLPEDIDGLTRHWLSRLLEDLGGGPVRLDCGKVRSLGGTGLATLVALHKKARAKGGRLTLCNVAPLVYEVLEVTRLTRLLDARPRGQGRPC
jgi:anti-anti-sigma factor